MPSGYPKNWKNHAVMIPRFAGVDTGLTGITFGGFLMDKYPNAQPSAVNEAGSSWYDVAHSGAAGSVPGISKPGVPVWDYITFPQAMIACANKGKEKPQLADSLSLSITSSTQDSIAIMLGKPIVVTARSATWRTSSAVTPASRARLV